MDLVCRGPPPCPLGPLWLTSRFPSCPSWLSLLYFLNRFSNAARASFGRKVAGVEVSFSRVTRIS